MLSSLVSPELSSESHVAADFVAAVAETSVKVRLTSGSTLAAALERSEPSHSPGAQKDP